MLSAVAAQFHLFAVLRHRDFRLYWAGLLSQVVGQQMLWFTIGWLSFHLTESPAFVGSVTLFLGLPQLLVALFGGVFADRLDQRRVIAGSQAFAAVVVAGLAALTILGLVEPWHLLLAAFLTGVAQSFDQPSRQVLYPRLLPDRSLLSQAVPLNAMTWQFARPIAPAIGGAVVAYAGAGPNQGAGPAFALSAATFLVMSALILRVSVAPGKVVGRASVLRNLAEGLGYVRRQPLFRIVIGMTYVSSLSGLGYIFVLPVFAGEVLETGPSGLSLLWASGGVGSFIAVLTTPAVLRRVPTGKAMALQGMLFGASLTAFAFTSNLWAGAALQVLIGGGSLAFMMAVEVTMQTLVPDELRGRVMSLWGLSWILPTIGAAGLNFIAGIIGAPLALALGGALVFLNAGAAWTLSARLRCLNVATQEGREAAMVAA
ncbi:MAG: MFS transporter [Dehalococcoidia bacterium]|nr:MFS transporter [Dehalococcoidia bacterium]